MKSSERFINISLFVIAIFITIIIFKLNITLMRIAGFCFVVIAILIAFQYILFEGISDFNGDLRQAQGNLETIKYCFMAQVLLFVIAGVSMMIGASNTEAKINELLYLNSKKNDEDGISNNARNDISSTEIHSTSTSQTSFSPRLGKDLQEVKNIIGDNDKKLVADLIISFCKNHTVPKELSSINPNLTKQVVSGAMPLGYIESLFQLHIDEPKRIDELETIIKTELS